MNDGTHIAQRLERGSAEANKVQLGVLTCEWHGWRWKFGLCGGPWYLGALLGPGVVTLGKRRFFASREERWTVAFDLLDVEPPFVDGLK